MNLYINEITENGGEFVWLRIKIQRRQWGWFLAVNRNIHVHVTLFFLRKSNVFIFAHPCWYVAGILILTAAHVYFIIRRRSLQKGHMKHNRSSEQIAFEIYKTLLLKQSLLIHRIFFSMTSILFEYVSSYGTKCNA